MSSNVLRDARRIVVKVGSSLVTNEGRGLDETAIQEWSRQLAAHSEGVPNYAMIEHITTNSAMCENGTTILRKDIDPSALEAASGRPPLTLRNFVRQHRAAFGAATANA